MSAQRYDVLIVGSGHGGAQTAISLRQLGFGGSIGLLSRENHPPYQRPPLSKDYLSGVLSFDRILLRPVSFWSGHSIDLLSGLEVTAVVERIEPPGLFDWFVEFRERIGMHIVPLGPEAGRSTVAAVKAGSSPAIGARLASQMRRAARSLSTSL